MKLIKKVGLIFLKILLVIFGIVALLLAAFWIYKESGKSSLYKKADSVSIELPKETINAETLLNSTLSEKDVVHNGEIYRYNEDILTFLLMGIDNKNPVPKPEEVINYIKGGQADMLFLAVVNPHNKEVSLIGVNRNTMTSVEVCDTNGNLIGIQSLQVCLAHGFGDGLQQSCEKEVASVAEIFYKIPIHGYASINMGAILDLNELVNGVEVELLEKIPYPYASWELSQNLGTKVILHGNDAYWYVRYRNTDDFDSASCRLERQEQYIGAFIQKLIPMVKKDIGMVATLYNTASDYMVTNVSLSEATYLATELLGYKINFDQIYLLEGETIRGETGFEEFYPDEDALYNLVLELFYEKVPS